MVRFFIWGLADGHSLNRDADDDEYDDDDARDDDDDE